LNLFNSSKEIYPTKNGTNATTPIFTIKAKHILEVIGSCISSISFPIEYIELPRSTGIPEMKLYSSAVYLSNPPNIPDIVVIPDLDVPGINAKV